MPPLKIPGLAGTYSGYADLAAHLFVEPKEVKGKMFGKCRWCGSLMTRLIPYRQESREKSTMLAGIAPISELLGAPLLPATLPLPPPEIHPHLLAHPAGQ